jgi:hypothetical protein
VNSHPQHYSTEQWADFVRQVGEHDQILQMKAHLAGGCGSCAKTVQWLQAVVQAVAFSTIDEVPPAAWVAEAKSVFRQQRAEQPQTGWREQLETLVARLSMVSSGEWLPYGVRSAGMAGQRLVYRAGRYAIDLTMDQGTELGEVGEIVGQIVDEQQVDAGTLGRVLVQLWIGDRVLGETETNRFGEFVLQRPTSSAAVLRFALTGQGKQIELRLKNTREHRKQ